MATYKIQTNDTLSGIAAANKTDIQSILKANPTITDPNKIFAGADLILPDRVQPGAVLNSTNLAGGSNAIVPVPVNNTGARNDLGVTAGKTSTTATPPAYDPVSGLITDYGKSLQPPAPVESPTKSIIDKLKEAIGMQATKGDFTEQARVDTGLADKRSELTALNNEALLTKQSYQDQIKKLKETNPNGQFAGGLEASVRDLSEKADERLANIGIKQLVAQNNVNGALTTIDEKVKAKFEPIDNQIESLSKLFTLYQNDMTEKEKFDAQQKIDALKGTKNENSTAYSTALKTAVDNNAPVSILNAIDSAAKDPKATAASIYAALGSYGAKKTTTPTGAKITLAKATQLGLPPSTVGMSEQDLADSLYENTPPSWFVEKFEKEQKRTVANTSTIQPIWDSYRNTMLGNPAVTKAKMPTATVIGNVRALRSKGATDQDIHDYIYNSGYDPEDPAFD